MCSVCQYDIALHTRVLFSIVHFLPIVADMAFIECNTDTYRYQYITSVTHFSEILQSISCLGFQIIVNEQP
jgi:hypothetical protein